MVIYRLDFLFNNTDEIHFLRSTFSINTLKQNNAIKIMIFMS